MPRLLGDHTDQSRLASRLGVDAHHRRQALSNGGLAGTVTRRASAGYVGAVGLEGGSRPGPADAAA